MPVNSRRADSALVDRGLARSRASASELIKQGLVTCQTQVIKKPSQLVSDDTELVVNAPISFDAVLLFDTEQSGFSEVRESRLGSDTQLASRAGHKLERAIAELRGNGHQVDISGKNCLDIGASTGGFTQVLLNNDAEHVIALDVGHGQLVDQLRENPKVTVKERVNARYLTAEQLPYHPQFITCDVSFISLTMLLPTIQNVAASNAQLLLLIKPQFEVGKGKLGKGGIVRDENLIQAAIQQVTDAAQATGITVTAIIPSAIPGTNGNQEYFLFGALHKP